MPDILVTDVESGEQRYIPQESFDSARHALAEGQVATVDPLEAGGEFAVGLPVTAATIEEAAPLREVSPEARAALTREQVDDVVFDTTANTIEQAVRGAAAGATFGLSEAALRGDDPFERERQRRKRGQASTAFDVSQIVGAVAPSLLTGGTGLVGVGARLTPAGRLGMATTKLAAKGGITRTAVAGAAEAAAGAVGEAVSRASLSEDPEFSAEAIVSSALVGGLLGGGLGIVGLGAKKLAAKGADALAAPAAAKATKIADDLVPPVKSPVGLFGKAPTKRTSYKRIVRKKLANTSADSARGLGARIDDMATASAARELDDLLLKVPTGGADDLAAQARKLSAEYDEAATAAKTWFSRYADDVALGKAKSKLTKEVSDEVEDAGILALQRLDETAHKFDRVADELAARAGVQRAGNLATPIGEAGQKLNRTLRERVSGTGQRLGSLGERVVGAGELAQTAGLDTGLPSVRDIPIIGGLASLYLQAKTGFNVAKGRGLVPGSRVTQAAEKTISLSDRISATVRQVAEKGLRRVATSPRALTLVPAQVAAQVAQITSISPTVVAGQVRAETEDTTEAVSMAAVNAAVRAQEYLSSVAPSDPIPMRPASMPPWVPSPEQTSDWSRRLWATENPIDALTASLIDPTATLEVEAVRVVWPALWGAYRQGLAERQAELIETLSLGQLDTVGRNFDLPMTIANIPGYGVSIATREDGQALGADMLDPKFAAPSGATTSPLVTGEETPSQRRPYA